MLEKSLRIGEGITRIQNAAKFDLEEVSSRTGGKSVRIGVTGSPGAGKSTFINLLVKRFIELDFSIAVLLIDPSSLRSGGALLADRSRLNPELLNSDVYIRSLSSENSSDGLPEKLLQILLFLEGESFDLIIIETIGTGQESVSIRSFCDLLITIPSNDIGDIMQFFKMGSFEVADFIFFSKSDLLPGGLESRNENLMRDFLVSKNWGNEKPPSTFFGNSVTKDGSEEILQSIENFLRKGHTNEE